MAKQHEAVLVDPAGFDHFDTTTNEGGAGIDFQYGVKTDGTRTLQAITFDGETITAEAAQEWLKKAKIEPAIFVPDTCESVNAAWVPNAYEANWDAESSSRTADDASRDANMPAEHHQEAKHATAAASHRKAAADHEKAAAMHDAKEREATAAGDPVTSATHKQRAVNSRAEQARHEKEAGAHDKKLKDLHKCGDDEPDADDAKAGQDDAGQVNADDGKNASDQAVEPWRLKVQQMADAYGMPVERVRAMLFGATSQSGDIHALNPNHEPGSGRFAHGSGGTRKLQDAGANAASEVAHAATKSANAFTGSHAAAASAHHEAAAAAKKVQQRSEVEFNAALARKDQLGAVAHSSEAGNAAANHAQHLKMALEHETRAKQEAEHAIRTGLAGQLPDPAKPKLPEKKPSMIGRAVVGLARVTGKVTVAAVKAPFQVAAWAVHKGEAGRKARAEQRAAEHSATAAKNAGEAAQQLDKAISVAKSAPLGLPAPTPKPTTDFVVESSGQARRSGPSPSMASTDAKHEGSLSALHQYTKSVAAAKSQSSPSSAASSASSYSPSPRRERGEAEQFQNAIERVNRGIAERKEQVSRASAEQQRIATAMGGDRPVNRAKVGDRPSWMTPEARAEEAIDMVADAILAARQAGKGEEELPDIVAAAVASEFPSIHAEVDGDVIFAGQSSPGKKPRFVIKPAYNGGPIQVSAYKLPIIVDLAGMSVNSQSVAANLHHDTTKIVGHADNVDNNGKTLNLSGPISGAGASATEFRESHANGFPWKASIEARPKKKPEMIAAGKSVKVNGRTWPGPVLVARETELYGVAFVPRGADDKTSVDIAARAAGTIIRSEENHMDELTFAEWLDALGLVEAELKPEQITSMKAKHADAMKAIKAAAAAGGGSGDGGGGTAAVTAVATDAFDVEDIRAEFESHVEQLEVVYAEYEDEEGLAKSELKKIQASAKKEARLLKQKAIAERWAPSILAAKCEAARSGVSLSLLRASRPTGVSIVSGRPNPEVTGNILAAALLQAGNYHQQRVELTSDGKEEKVSVETLEDVFDEQTLNAADKAFHGGIGLQELLLEAAQANGYKGRKFPHQYYGEVLQAAFCQGPYMPIHAAGESSTDLGGILSNYLNKFLLQGFYQVEQVWRQIASIRRVEDFKQSYSYRMNADSMFQPLAAGGGISQGVLTDETFTNRARTYAKGFSLSRETIINDDLSAMIQVPVQIGRGSGLQINDMFWRAWLAVAAFWQSTGNAITYAEGAATALSIDSMSAAETLFLNMQDAGGNPIGHQPEKLLVPVALGPLAAALFNSAELRDTTGSTKYPVNNPHTGKYKPVVSRYLSNSRYPGYSAKAWYLLGDQQVISPIEVCFLFGQEAPTIESAAANFNTLGVDFRGFHDAGVNRQDHRGGVKMKGESA